MSSTKQGKPWVFVVLGVASCLGAGPASVVHAAPLEFERESTHADDCVHGPTDCVLAIVYPGEDPVVDAVRQLRLAGDESRAQDFAVQRLADLEMRDEAQLEIELLLQTDVNDIRSPSSALTAGVGQFTRWYWSDSIQLEYTYCTPAGCDPKTVGSVVYGTTQDIFFYPDIVINGLLGIIRGPRIKVPEWRCTTYHETVVDWPVHEWETCKRWA